MMKLIIANKAYSSWSLRPWILMKMLDLPFQEDLIPLDTPEFRPRVEAYHAGSTVPILVDGDITVWESLSIMEYLADKFPEKAVWPKEPAARAFARTIASEMHAGFRGLRQACPMNIRKVHPAKDRGEAVARDVARLMHLWSGALSHFGKPSAAGPFLFGAFGAADAMFAPMVTRLVTYSIPVAGVVKTYCDAVLNTQAFRQWHQEAMAEAWVVAHDEADEPVQGPFPLPV
jgi:glutathione S-transferase